MRSLIRIFVLVYCFGAAVRGQEFQIEKVELDGGGNVVVEFRSEAGSYYRLLRGVDLIDFAVPVSVGLAQPPTGVLVDEEPVGSFGFYQVQRVLLEAPFDSDGDEIDDVYELERPDILDPVDPGDAGADPDLNGLTHLEEYRLATSGPVEVLATSPRNGEQGVALTRETVVRFSGPLSPAARLLPDRFSASAAGVPLTGRMQLSKDRKTLTLFYDEVLPADSQVHVSLNGDLLPDSVGRAVDADGDGGFGGTREFSFSTVSLQGVPGTAALGRVFASELMEGNGQEDVNRPLAGVRVYVDGAEETLFTETDALGNFRIEPVPAGRIFVHIDGKQSPESDAPDGDYYPSVGKAWQILPGTDNVVGEIYLPLIHAGTLQPVSADDETEVEFPAAVLQEFPEFAGTKVTVPADALYHNDGRRGGRVGISPVPPGRLPGQLPPGLNFPLVITVQTDGATNFDEPVAACFPNLPDPVTGVRQGPGAKSALWSFDHDKGKFEVIGQMTVSEDGEFVCTNEGVGIRAPGWHGAFPGISADGGRIPEEFMDVHPMVRPILEDFANIAGKARRCAGDAGILERVILGVAEVGGTIAQINEVVSMVTDSYGSGGLTNEDLGIATSLLLTALETLEADIDELRTGPDDGLASVRRTLDCAKLLVDELCAPDGPCDRLAALDPGIVPATALEVCSVLPTMKAGMAELEGLLDYEEEVSIADIRQQVMELQDAAAVLPPEGSADPAVLAMGETLGDSFLAPLGLTEDDMLQVQNALNQMSDVNAGIQGATPGAVVRIDYADTVIRGRANSAGEFSFVLPADNFFSISMYDPVRQLCGRIWSESGVAGQVVTVSGPPRGKCGAEDADGDLIPDEAEAIVGTLVDNADTDGDGLSDHEELLLGLDPLDAEPDLLAGAIVASVPTDQPTVDVATGDGFAVLSKGTAGVAIYNIFEGMSPVLVGQVDTPGDARRVACAGDRIVVADGSAGLAVIDSSFPPGATVMRQLDLGGTVAAVAVEGSVAYAAAGLTVHAVDVRTGDLLASLALPSQVLDLGVVGGFLYACRGTTLDVLAVENGVMVPRGSVATAFGMRVFAGGGTAYVSTNNGYTTVDVSDPDVPVVVAAASAGRFGWRQIVANGSGLGVSVIRPNIGDLATWDLSDPGVTNALVADVVTPGVAQAVSLYNALSYVADGTGGMQVVNHEERDLLGVPPTVALSGDFPMSPASVTEGRDSLLVADVADDVEVREVVFFIDGVEVGRDRSFPFEHRFTAPLLSGGADFEVSAMAVDTGGNGSAVSPVTVSLLEDTEAPEVRGFSPAPGSTVSDVVETIYVMMDGRVDPAGLAGGVELTGAGGDGVLGTGDDVVITALVTFRNDLNAIVIVPVGGGVSNGDYRVEVRPPLSDRSGNVLAAAVSADFTVADTTAPVVLATSPVAGAALVDGVLAVRAEFSEGMDAATLDAGSFSVSSSGADGVHGTADDVVAGGGTVALDAGGTVATLTFAQALPAGRYAARLAGTVTDVAGNAIAPEEWRFSVLLSTTVKGTVVLAGSPVAGARVTFGHLPGSATSGDGGVFSYPGLLIDPFEVINVYASARVGGDDYLGSATGVVATGDGVTDVGVIVFEETYDPEFERHAFPPLGVEYPVAAFGEYQGEVYAVTTEQSFINDESFDADAQLVRWTGSGWAQVPGEFVAQEGRVVAFTALAAFNGELYVGGTFEGVDGVVTDGLAKWNGSVWSRPGGGLEGQRIGGGRTLPVSVTALVEWEGKLYAGGSFREADGIESPGVAAWDGTAWSGLAGGITGQFPIVRALESFDGGDGGALYVSGSFGGAGGVTGSLIRWDGAAWSNVGGGGNAPPEQVTSFEVFDDGGGAALYAGGAFLELNGSDANGVARWDGTTWSVVVGAADEVVRDPRFGSQNVDLEVFGGELYVTGRFLSADASRQVQLMRWDGTSWRELVVGANWFGSLSALQATSGGGGKLFFGGNFARIDLSGGERLPAVNAATWDGVALGVAGEGFGGPVHALKMFGGDLYAAGEFTMVGSNVVNHIARRTAGGWIGLGGGTDGVVNVLELFDDGGGEALYAGGEFSMAGGVAAANLAKWDGGAWSGLGGGTDGEVKGLAVFDGGDGAKLFACGGFGTAGGVPANRLACWDGTDWANAGTAPMSAVNVLVVGAVGADPPALFAGGNLGSTLRSVGRWDGEEWTAVGNQLTGEVKALVVFDDGGSKPQLIAGGGFGFTAFPGPSLRVDNVVRLNPDTSLWEPMGEGLEPAGGPGSNEGVNALAVFDDGAGAAVYATGQFADDLFRPSIAKWDGSEWQELGRGLSSPSDGGLMGIGRALAVFDDGSGEALFVGGDFRLSGDQVLYYMAKWRRPDCP